MGTNVITNVVVLPSGASNLQMAQAWVQIIGLSITIIAVLYAGWQLKLAKRQFRDLHDWNRRKASHDTFELFAKMADSNRLINTAFNYLDNHDPISIESIEIQCKADSGLKSAIHRLLNFNEGLALGIKQKVLDEEIIRGAFEFVVTQSYHQFYLYIMSRQKPSPGVWDELEYLVKSWKKSGIPERQATGKT